MIREAKNNHNNWIHLKEPKRTHEEINAANEINLHVGVFMIDEVFIESGLNGFSQCK